MSETDIEGDVMDESIGYLLEAALSDTNIVDNGDGTYTHIFNRKNDTCNSSYSVYDANSVKNKQASYNMLDSLELKYVAGQPVKFKAIFKGKKIVDATSDIAPTYNNVEDGFMSSNAVIKFASDITGLDTAEIVELKEFNITIQKKVKETEALH